MKTWKDATIKRELERLAEGLQEIDKTIISCVRIDRSVVSDKRTVTAYTDFGKNEWLVRITFNFEINMMMIEHRGDEPQLNTITALKRSVDFALTCINATFDDFEIYYGAPYESFLPIAEAEEVAEETTEQPKEEQQVTVVENPKLFAEDLAQSLNEAGFATSYKKSYLGYQGAYNIHAMADKGVMVEIDFDAGICDKLSTSAVVYDLADCSVIDGGKYNTEADYIKAIVEKVISSSNREQKIVEANKIFESTDTTDDKVRKLQKEFRLWEVLQEREKEADEAYEANYKDKELEKTADEAYAAEYKQYDKIARMIAELINIDVLTAKGMLMKTPKHVKKILGL